MSSEAENTLVLYHIPGFRSTRPLWLYYELKELYGDRKEFPGLRLELFDRSTFRTDKPASYLALNPNGKVPTLQHGDDVVIWDGTAICNYLLERFDFDGLLSHPGDWKFRAAFHHLSYYTCTVDNLCANSSTIQRVMNDPMPGSKPEVVEANLEFWNTVAGPALEKQLGDRQYLFGDSFSAIDVITGYTMTVKLRKSRPEAEYFANFPNLKAYAERLSQRECLKSAIKEQ